MTKILGFGEKCPPKVVLLRVFVIQTGYPRVARSCFIKKNDGEVFNLNMIDMDLKRISSVAPIPNISGDKTNYESLRLVPHPYSWTPSAGVCNLCPPINVIADEDKKME